MSASPNGAATLCAWRNPASEARIAVEGWCAHTRVIGQYIEPPRSLRLIWQYVRRVGVIAVLRKVVSRRSERARNQKVAGIGFGQVVEAPHLGPQPGQRVLFFAPNHSLAWPWICVGVDLLIPLEETDATTREARSELPDSLRPWIGWSPYSGHNIDAATVQRALRELIVPSKQSRQVAEEYAVARRYAEVTERLPFRSDANHRPTAVVFGLGNYAKTQILPHVRRHMHVRRIHEIDPDQIHAAAKLDAILDTSPIPRHDERYDAWFIAGFHHTHSSIAVRAIETGGYAVVEKPLVTNRDQLEDVQRALHRCASNNLFVCFHKRYAIFNDWAREDLKLEPHAPVDMHSIVYEIPLPVLHWYNWPNSGSRITSNGCHWLDYFLYMNSFCAVQDCGVIPMRSRDVSMWVRLVNGAQLVLSLTDSGSQRLGVREVIELRTRDSTVRMIDASHYEAENSSRVLRRRRVNPLDAHRRMYGSICRSIVAGLRADSVDSLRSTVLTLDLEDELRGLRSR